MLRVIDCITQEHDLRLVALAACLCALACTTTVNLMAAAQTKEGGSSLAHLVAASVVFGCGVWSLHFVAMLAFMASMPISVRHLTDLRLDPLRGRRRSIGSHSLAILAVAANRHCGRRGFAQLISDRHAFLWNRGNASFRLASLEN